MGVVLMTTSGNEQGDLTTPDRLLSFAITDEEQAVLDQATPEEREEFARLLLAASAGLERGVGEVVAKVRDRLERQ